MDSRLSIRAATPDDAPAILAMLENPWDVRQVAPQEEPPLVEASIEAWMRKADRSFVMERDGRVVGFAALLRDQRSPGVWWLGHVVIEARSRGLGLGQRFVRSLLAAAEKIDALREIRLSAFRDNPAARRAYYRCGFVETSRWREDGRTLCEMRWRNPRSLRGVSRPVAAVLGFIAATISATLLPWTARFWLLDHSTWLVAFLLLATGGITAVCAYQLQPLLPTRGAPLSHRLGRPVVYGALVGVIAAGLSATMLLMLRSLGWIHLETDAQILLPEVLEGGLRHGAAWGLVLLMALDLAPQALGMRRRLG